MNWKSNALIFGAAALVFLAMLAMFSAATNGQETKAPAPPEARERVFNLPQDEMKWFISIVGSKEEQHYKTLLSWFDTNADLQEMKTQVHFHKIATNSIAFKERYAKDVGVFPTIRVQKADGYVVYEAAGSELPGTAEELLTEVGYASHLAGGPIFNRDGRVFPIFPIFRRPLLPYRHRQEQQQKDCDTCPAPSPPPESDINVSVGPQPEPKPNGMPLAAILSLGVISLVGGGLGSAVSQWKKLSSAAD